MTLKKLISVSLLFFVATCLNAEQVVERVSISIAQSGPFKQVEELNFLKIKKEVETLEASGKSVEIVLTANFNQSEKIEEVLEGLKKTPGLENVPVIQIFSD